MHEEANQAMDLIVFRNRQLEPDFRAGSGAPDDRLWPISTLEAQELDVRLPVSKGADRAAAAAPLQRVSGSG